MDRCCRRDLGRDQSARQDRFGPRRVHRPVQQWRREKRQRDDRWSDVCRIASGARARSYADATALGFPNALAHGVANSIAHANASGIADADTDCIADANADRIAHADGIAYAHHVADAHADANRIAHAYADAYTDADTNADANANTNADTHTDAMRRHNQSDVAVDRRGSGGGTVTVTNGASCAWTATSNATWITIASGASGTGNGTVTFSVAANSGVARTGTLTIAGGTFTVTQASGGAY